MEETKAVPSWQFMYIEPRRKLGVEGALGPMKEYTHTQRGREGLQAFQPPRLHIWYSYSKLVVKYRRKPLRFKKAGSGSQYGVFGNSQDKAYMAVYLETPDISHLFRRCINANGCASNRRQVLAWGWRQGTLSWTVQPGSPSVKGLSRSDSEP